MPSQERIGREGLEHVEGDLRVEPREGAQRRELPEGLVRHQGLRQPGDGEPLRLRSRQARGAEGLRGRGAYVDVLVVQRPRQRPRSREIRHAPEDLDGELSPVGVEDGELTDRDGDGIAPQEDQRLDGGVPEAHVVPVVQGRREAFEHGLARLDGRRDRRRFLADAPVAVPQSEREQRYGLRPRDLRNPLRRAPPYFGVGVGQQHSDGRRSGRRHRGPALAGAADRVDSRGSAAGGAMLGGSAR